MPRHVRKRRRELRRVWRNDRCVVMADDLMDLVVAIVRTYWVCAIDDLYFDKESESGFVFATVYDTSEVVADEFSIRLRRRLA